MTRPWITYKGNIYREKLVDLSLGDFTNDDGFFIRSEGGATITYIPYGNEDNEIITKTLPASASFQDPVLCRKIFASGSPLPDDIYVGYGV